jgi:glycosyltransferase involved in cell wall biosynthesis
MFNITEALENQGHEVIPFSINYTKNVNSSYSSYFVDPLGNKDEIYFRDQKKDLKTIIRTSKRLFYDDEVADKVETLVADTIPDVAYLLQYLRKLSPALLVGLKRRGLPIVARVSDFAMLCPESHGLRAGLPCELCFKGNISSSIKYRCVKNSLSASLLNASATTYHRYKGFFSLIDKFVLTNHFMADKMLEAGFPENKLVTIPTFAQLEKWVPDFGNKKLTQFIYVGRLDFEKGVHILIDAIIKLRKRCPDLRFECYLVGDGEKGYVDQINSLIQDNALVEYIKTTGMVDPGQIIQTLQTSAFSVVPSIWYENLPNSLLESFATGTPVIASNHGSLAMTVDEGKTGLLFIPLDSEDLSHKIEILLENPGLARSMGENARNIVEANYSEEAHLSKLVNLFESLKGKSGPQ